MEIGHPVIFWRGPRPTPGLPIRFTAPPLLSPGTSRLLDRQSLSAEHVAEEPDEVDATHFLPVRDVHLLTIRLQFALRAFRLPSARPEVPLFPFRAT